MAELTPPPSAAYGPESPDDEPDTTMNEMVVDSEGEGANEEPGTTVDDTVLGPKGELTFMRGESNPQ
jgi:hypothetical protein